MLLYTGEKCQEQICEEYVLLEVIEAAVLLLFLTFPWRQFISASVIRTNGRKYTENYWAERPHNIQGPRFRKFLGRS